MYNILTDRLPTTVNIGGTEYPINYGFRTSLRFERMLHIKNITDELKIQHMLSLYYPTIPLDYNKAVETAMWFFNCERKKIFEDSVDKKSFKKKHTKVSYSFSQDSNYIFTSFMEQYHIDLQQIKENDLHWWQFIALFDSLREDTQMGKIMYYRTVSTSGMPNAKRRAVNELKKQYALKDEVSCDMKVALAKRNADWKEYVRKRVSSINI